MAGIYDRADIYDLFENEERYLAYKKHWKADVLKTLEQMDALVKDGGYLYFDLRNWEKIVREKERFSFMIRCLTGKTASMSHRYGTTCRMER